MTALYHVVRCILVLPVIGLLLIAAALSSVTGFLSTSAMLLEGWVFHAFPSEEDEPPPEGEE